MSINSCLILIGICLFGIMLFVMVISFVLASRYDYDKAKAARKHNDEHVYELIRNYDRHEI